MKHKHLRGFTIVELLIVIVVIGILAGIGFLTYNNIAKKAEYTKTITAVNEYAKAIQMYGLKNNSLPIPDDPNELRTGWNYYCLGTIEDYPPLNFPDGKKLEQGQCGLIEGTIDKDRFVSKSLSAKLSKLLEQNPSISPHPTALWKRGVHYSVWISNLENRTTTEAFINYAIPMGEKCPIGKYSGNGIWKTFCSLKLDSRGNEKMQP